MMTELYTALANQQPARIRHRVQWLVAAVLLAGATLVIAMWFLSAPSPTVVITTTPDYEDLRSSVASIGRVVPEHEFQARASFPGLIDRIDVHLGEEVRPGQSLIRMKDQYAATRVAAAVTTLQTTQVGNENVKSGGSQEDHIQLQADLARAEQEKTAATGSLSTLKALHDSGAASGAEVRAAELRLQSAEQTLRFVQDRISKRYSPDDVVSWSTRVAEAKSNLASAKASLDNVHIVSPIEGTVYLMPVTSNDFVPTGAELLRVADLTRLMVHANFDEADMGKLHDGAPVEIRWEGKPDKLWHGIVKHAPMAAIIQGVRSVGECVITITDAKNDLPPNTSVAVSITVGQRQHVLTLPREALHTDAHASFVYRVEQDRLVQTPVEVGLLNLDRFEIVKGVSPDARVALHTMNDLNPFDGMKVKVRP